MFHDHDPEVRRLIDHYAAQGIRLYYGQGTWLRDDPIAGGPRAVPAEQADTLNSLVNAQKGTPTDFDIRQAQEQGRGAAANRYGQGLFEYHAGDPQGHQWQRGAADPLRQESGARYTSANQAARLDYWSDLTADRILRRRMDDRRRQFQDLFSVPETEGETEGEQEASGAPEGIPAGAPDSPGAGGRRGGGFGWASLLRRQRGYGMMSGGMAGVAALIGTSEQLARSGANIGTEAVRGIAGFMENALATALTSAAGGTGQGTAQIARGFVGLVTSGLSTAVGMGLGVAGALLEATAGGLRAVGGLAAFALTGALVGIFAGVIGSLGSVLGEAIGHTLGAVGQAAEASLQGVVTILRDLTQTGRQFSEGGFRLRGLGGVAAGQDIQTLLFGQAAGLGPEAMPSMFGRWGMGPWANTARFGALGVQVDQNDLPRTMIEAAQAIRELPPILRQPMANAATGGQGETLLRLAALPQAQLEAAYRMPRELGLDPHTLERIFERMNPAMARIGALSGGLKLEILDALLPLIETSVRGLFNLWREHQPEIRAFIRSLPQLIMDGLRGLLQASIAVVGFARETYLVLRDIWTWLRDTLGPYVGGFFRGATGGSGPSGHYAPGTPEYVGGFFRGATGGSGPSGHYAPGTPEAAREAAGQRWGTTARNVGGFVADHPYATAAALLLGPTVLSAGGNALLRGAGGWFARGAAGAAAGGGAAEAAGGGAAAASGAGGLFPTFRAILGAPGRAWAALRGAPSAAWNALRGIPGSVGGALGSEASVGMGIGAGAAAGSAIGGLGIGMIGAGLGGSSVGGQALAGFTSVVAGALTGALVGGPAGALIGASAAAIGGVGRLAYEAHQARQEARSKEQDFQAQNTAATRMGYVTPEEYARRHGFLKQYESEGMTRDQWAGFRAERRAAGRPAGGIAAQQQAAAQQRDPVLERFDRAQRELQRLLTNMPRIIADTQREARMQEQTAKIDLGVKIDPSPEFAARMEAQQAMALLRGLQLRVT